MEKIISFNSLQQNELMVWYCLEHSNLDKFQELLKTGLSLSAFMLNSMVFFSYDKEIIKEILLVSKNVEKDVVPWMRAYFQVADLADVLPDFENLLPDDYPTNDECVQLKLWNTLLRRKQYDLLAQNAPEILVNENSYDAYVALLKLDPDKYIDHVFQKGFYGAIVVAVKDGWKYIVDHGQAKWLLKLGDACGLLPREEIVDYLLLKGCVDELYEAQFYKELLEHQEFAVFVKNHSTYSGFLEQCPDQVSWEELWTEHKDESVRKDLIKKALMHPEVQKSYDFLWNHGGWWTRWCLLTGM